MVLRWLAKVTGEGERSVAVPQHDPIIILPEHQAKRYFDRIEKSLARFRVEYDVREIVDREYRQVATDRSNCVCSTATRCAARVRERKKRTGTGSRLLTMKKVAAPVLPTRATSSARV